MEQREFLQGSRWPPGELPWPFTWVKSEHVSSRGEKTALPREGNSSSSRELVPYTQPQGDIKRSVRSYVQIRVLRNRIQTGNGIHRGVPRGGRTSFTATSSADLVIHLGETVVEFPQNSGLNISRWKPWEDLFFSSLFFFSLKK